jgi:FkbM family methyltransferase
VKKIFKIIIEKFAKNFVKISYTSKIGRYFTEHLAKYIFEQKRNVNYNNIKLAFYSPNRLIRFRIDTFSSKEPETLGWIEKFNQNSIFWDIGANIGLYSCYAAKLKDCSVYAFEPSIFNLEVLTKNVFLNQLSNKVSIISFPLIDKLKETEFKMTMTDWGGAVSTFGEDYKYDGLKIDKRFNYNTVGLSMDECVDVLKMRPPDYIKIDVDGIEHLILKGGSQTLSKTKSVLVEVDQNFTLQVKKTEEYLTKAGLKLKGKLQSDSIKKSEYKSIFNQIWERD